MRPSYLYNGNSFSGETVYLHQSNSGSLSAFYFQIYIIFWKQWKYISSPLKTYDIYIVAYLTLSLHIISFLWTNKSKFIITSRTFNITTLTFQCDILTFHTLRPEQIRLPWAGNIRCNTMKQNICMWFKCQWVYSHGFRWQWQFSIEADASLVEKQMKITN